MFQNSFSILAICSCVYPAVALAFIICIFNLVVYFQLILFDNYIKYKCRRAVGETDGRQRIPGRLLAECGAGLGARSHEPEIMT